MKTECIPTSFAFHPLGGRQVTARFDGETITSDGGGLLLRKVEQRARIIEQFAACFDDFRDPAKIEHTVLELLKQRIFCLALGYEDLNDHEQLRHDPLLAVLVDKRDPTGEERLARRSRGVPLAGKSTLNRLELTPSGATAAARYKKIAARHHRIEKFFVDTFVQLQESPPDEIVLDLDATDDPLHGHQLGRFFHGYYDGYCYLPLYIFCGEHLLCVKMRANQLRLWLSSVACVLLQALRQKGLKDTECAKSRCNTIRITILNVGDVVRVTVRHVWLSFAESYPYQKLFAQILVNLHAWCPAPLLSG